ncbi:hypothetical protein DACRYDRAFT_21998, partial [Dacryopinax primogenitus]
MYKKLLDSLLAPPPNAFDFESYFVSTGLDETQPFGDWFIASIHELVEDSGFEGLQTAVCLKDMASAWSKAVEQLGVEKVDDTLEVVYRLQPRPKFRRARGAAATASPPLASVVEDRGTPPLPDM